MISFSVTRENIFSKEKKSIGHVRKSINLVIEGPSSVATELMWENMDARIVRTVTVNVFSIEHY